MEQKEELKRIIETIISTIDEVDQGNLMPIKDLLQKEKIDIPKNEDRDD